MNSLNMLYKEPALPANQQGFMNKVNSTHPPYARIAMNRFANGASQNARKSLNDKATIEQAQQWLLAQLAPYNLPKASFTSTDAILGHAAFRRKTLADQQSASENKNADMNNMGATQGFRKSLVKAANTEAEQTGLAAITTNQPLQAKLLDFFSNHFSVSRQNLRVQLLAPTLETEAIAPNLHLNFSAMLIAVTKHPAMLIYLNNERSIGPNSKQAAYRKKKQHKNIGGLNENLAREILELHTLGVNSGYTQIDVSELARAITGWSVGNTDRNETATFMFRAKAHEPGVRQILNQQYAYVKGPNGDEQGTKILHNLANHPATAAYISRKLATHFINDTPSESLVASMKSAWLSSSGNIPSVIKAMIVHPDSWRRTSQKFKTPREFVISSCRAFNMQKPSPSFSKTLDMLGQGLFNAGSPAGYADTESAWLGASALNTRIEWASQFAAKVTNWRKNIQPIEIAHNALGPLLSAQTAQFINRAESKQQALTLFLMSPEFQRR